MSEKEHGFILLGRDVSKIPCFRKSFMNGIGGGLGVGIAYFFYSSNPRKSSHVGFFSYLAITLGTWAVCRYQFARAEIAQQQLKAAIQASILGQGTELEKQIKAETSDV